MTINHDQSIVDPVKKLDLNGYARVANGVGKDGFKVRKICCVGAGYVGGPTAAVIAFQNPHIKVTVVDRDEARIRRWNSRHPPIYEPGLHQIVRITRDGSQEFRFRKEGALKHEISVPARPANLFFTTDMATSIGEADIILVAVSTPTKERGAGAGRATDMTAFEAATATLAQYAKEGAIIVEKSTVPCRTAQLVSDVLAIHRPGTHFEILSNPEFLAASTAVNDLLYPDRVLIGSAPTPSGHRAAMALASVYAWVPQGRIITTNIWSSELAKLVANSMLAQRISSINSIAAICEKTGANVDEVADAIGVDARIGSKFLTAGIGFGGSCFKKDVLSLVYLADVLGLPEVSAYWQQVIKINEFARNRFTNRIIKCLNNTLVGKKVTILGYAFKKNTSDTREAPALQIIKTLLEERPRHIAVFDPCCDPQIIQEEINTLLGPTTTEVVVHGNAYEACDGATAVVIVTDFDEFRNQPASTQDSTGVQGVGSDCTPYPETDYRLSKIPSSPSNNLLELYKLLVQQPSKTSDDLLSQLNAEPLCANDCTTCIWERQSKKTGRTTISLTREYRTKEQIDWVRIANSMAKPRWVFDGRGVIDAKEMVKLGIRLETVGR